MDSLNTLGSRTRAVAEAFRAHETFEGAGVRLSRGFGFFETPRFDPFLLFDDFSSPNPPDYLPGFPWHPHRGMETVTYVLDGDIRHRDSIGNSGSINKGDVQWMTAGSGIVHEEMPQGSGGLFGFQLWINLPQKNKMISPRYQDIRAKEIPEIIDRDARVKVIAGATLGTTGPIEDIVASPTYLDAILPPGKNWTSSVPDGHTAFVYVVDGALAAEEGAEVRHPKGTIVLFERAGDLVYLRAGTTGARFLLVSGKPVGEPIAWRGPIVMNTQEELRTAFLDLERGTFIT